MRLPACLQHLLAQTSVHLLSCEIVAEIGSYSIGRSNVCCLSADEAGVGSGIIKAGAAAAPVVSTVYPSPSSPQVKGQALTCTDVQPLPFGPASCVCAHAMPASSKGVTCPCRCPARRRRRSQMSSALPPRPLHWHLHLLSNQPCRQQPCPHRLCCPLFWRRLCHQLAQSAQPCLRPSRRRCGLRISLPACQNRQWASQCHSPSLPDLQQLCNQRRWCPPSPDMHILSAVPLQSCDDGAPSQA